MTILAERIDNLDDHGDQKLVVGYGQGKGTLSRFCNSMKIF
jgi:hypothetical protein